MTAIASSIVAVFWRVEAVFWRVETWAWRMTAGVLIAGVLLFEIALEATYDRVVLGTGVVLSVFVLLLLLSRRLVFSAVATTGLILGLWTVSLTKAAYMGMFLHAYDLIFYFKTRGEIAFFSRAYPRIAGVTLGTMALALTALVMLWRYDPTRVMRRATAAAVAGVGVWLAFGIAITPQRDMLFHFFDRNPVTGFVRSLPDVYEVVTTGGTLSAEVGSDQVPALAGVAAGCPAREKRDIILILQESSFPPTLFPEISAPRTLVDQYRSYDGHIRGLRVETYGGGTWMSEFAVLSGLPARTLGSMAPFAYPLMKGRVQHALPQQLKACGYRTVAFYPSDESFAGSGPFYRSIGFDEVLDKPRLEADDEWMRDGFYFGKAMAWLKTHRAASRQPVFIFIVTSANHHPHDQRWVMPEVKAGLPPSGAGPEADEYLRRVEIGRRDYQAMRAELALTPERPVLIAHFGDHQPALTRAFFANVVEDGAKKRAGVFEDKAYLTYYALDPVGFAPVPQVTLPETIDIAYLGLAVLDAAGLPLDRLRATQAKFVGRCNGFLLDCGDGRIAQQLVARLMEAKLLGVQ